MRQKLLKKKSHMEWAWVFIIGFFILAIVNVYFGLLGLLCMTTPMFHAFKGKGKIHCSHYCPRGSIFGKFLPALSQDRKLPDFMRTQWFKNTLLGLMATMLTIALIHSHGNPQKIAFSLFRFMSVSFIVGLLMGIFYKPRAWCQICPMAHATGLIKTAKEK